MGALNDPSGFMLAIKISNPPSPGCPSVAKYNSFSSVTSGKVSFPSVLIASPKFTGVPNEPSPLMLTFQRSDCPLVPGISEAKYKVFSSGLNIGCAVLYVSLLKDNSVAFCQRLSLKVALYIFSKVILLASFPFLPSLKLFLVKYMVLPSLVKTGDAS